MYRLSELLFSLGLVLSAPGVVDANPDLLRLTAILSDEQDKARIECWQFDDSPFSEYPTVGKAMLLAKVSNITYVVLPPNSKEGIHRPPHPMLFVLVSGMAHVTLPDSPDDLWITEGKDNVIIAADTRGIGHYTDYPSNKETIALQIPFKSGEVPKHSVLGQGACSKHSDTFSDVKIPERARNAIQHVI